LLLALSAPFRKASPVSEPEDEKGLQKVLSTSAVSSLSNRHNHSRPKPSHPEAEWGDAPAK